MRGFLHEGVAVAGDRQATDASAVAPVSDGAVDASDKPTVVPIVGQAFGLLPRPSAYIENHDARTFVHNDLGKTVDQIFDERVREHQQRRRRRR
ncbi:MAG: hypothetical protein KBA31_19530 [Alphaproteobacteria bacterium]|nr:hypothetical protein [Alphaproteobacteria bacterium]